MVVVGERISPGEEGVHLCNCRSEEVPDGCSPYWSVLGSVVDEVALGYVRVQASAHGYLIR